MRPQRWPALVGTWLDRRLWLVVVLAFVAAEVGQVVGATLSARPILLSRADPNVRADVYSSLTGSSGALLGFTVAAVAILVTFAPRRQAGADRAHEDNLASARRKLVGVLLATSATLGVALALATLALGLDRTQEGRQWLEQLVVSAAVASLVGLALGGLGFALAVVERRTR